jgi:hypothetical protein
MVNMVNRCILVICVCNAIAEHDSHSEHARDNMLDAIDNSCNKKQSACTTMYDCFTELAGQCRCFPVISPAVEASIVNSASGSSVGVADAISLYQEYFNSPGHQLSNYVSDITKVWQPCHVPTPKPTSNFVFCLVLRSRHSTSSHCIPLSCSGKAETTKKDRLASIAAQHYERSIPTRLALLHMPVPR